MNRLNNLYQQIYSIENLQLADSIARKGKSAQYGVMAHDKNREGNIIQLHQMLKEKTYRTSEYATFKIFEPKERDVYRLPYFPDRITHHAVMKIMEPVFVSTFTADSYSCIKGKGIHAAANAVKMALRDEPGTQYCLKLDIKKFYPNVDHVILKQLLRRKLKDRDLLWLLDGIIDSAAGLPIGNYLSQYFANFYLTYFDHWIKEEKRVKYYFRYADDLVILSDNKPCLHQLLADIKQYLTTELNLIVKDNYQVFPVQARGIDFVGYRFYHTHTLLRKSIKKNFARKMKKNRTRESEASYYGWAKHADCKMLLRKLNVNLMTKFSDLNIAAPDKPYSGEKIKIKKILGVPIKILRWKIEPSKFPEKGDGKRLKMQISVGDSSHIVFTSATVLKLTIAEIPEDKLPVETTIVEKDECYYFT